MENNHTEALDEMGAESLAIPEDVELSDANASITQEPFAPAVTKKQSDHPSQTVVSKALRVSKSDRSNFTSDAGQRTTVPTRTKVNIHCIKGQLDRTDNIILAKLDYTANSSPTYIGDKRCRQSNESENQRDIRDWCTSK